MALPSNTTIYMSQMNDELGRPGAQYLTMNDAAVRNLAGRPSGIIYFSDLWGKSSYTPMNASPANVYDERQVASSGSNYTGSWQPGVSVSAGSGGYSFSWSFTSATNGFTLSNTGSQYATITHVISRFGSSASCTLNCLISDNTGHQVNVGVSVYFNYFTEI